MHANVYKGFNEAFILSEYYFFMKFLLKSYESRKSSIKQRLKEFKQPKNDEEIFAELCFCLLTPQSKAKLCWRAIEKLKEKGLLLNGSADDVKKWLAGVRFPNNKAEYIVNARNHFPLSLKGKKTHGEMREWLVKNVKGIGMKEASHFLRNIGYGDDIAILDRHILKNLKKFNVINEIPASLTIKKYLEIEERMKGFAKKTGIPFNELDLLFWSEETGEIFK